MSDVTPARAASAISRRQIMWSAAFVGSHLMLAIAMSDYAAIATAHAIGCTVGGIVYAATTRRIRNVALIVAYIAGCEVLWRMNRAAVFWELGKYSVAAILGVALLRIRWPRNRALALGYLGLLLPSIALTLIAIGPTASRQEIAFNLSGPLALAVAVIFFSNIRLSPGQVRAAFVAAIAPIAGVGMVSLISTRASVALEFSNGSNFAASGGFGPNQVAAALGLAVMLLLLLSFERGVVWRLRVALVVAAAALAAQSALTFARGGIVLALAGTCGAMFVLLRGSRRARLTVVVVAILSVVIGTYVVEPRLDRITKGKLSERYTNTSSSGRDVYASSELEMFAEHPALGVGPGMAAVLRSEDGLRVGASHTEYTRMLAEHGIFGILSLGCLIVLGYRAYRQARDPAAHALATAMVIWVALFLLIYGMRLAAPAVFFGFAFAMRAPPPQRRGPTALGSIARSRS